MTSRLKYSIINWHDASKELPKEGDTCLCLYNDYDTHTRISLLEHYQYCGDNWSVLDDWYEEWREIDVKNIKYWAELPHQDDIKEDLSARSYDGV